MRKYTSNAGFSMMELLVTLLILGLVAALGLPSLDQFIEDNRLNAAVADLQSAMQTGRAEAVGRNAYVTLCKKNADSTDCVTNGGWQQGWIIFVDANGDGDVDAGEDILLIHEPLLGVLTFHGTAGVKDLITFRPSGQTSITSLQTLVLCDDRGFVDDAKALVVSIMGRASTMSATSSGQADCLIP
jgi:type IV fimbrial biogenesis protein FimT